MSNLIRIISFTPDTIYLGVRDTEPSYRSNRSDFYETANAHSELVAMLSTVLHVLVGIS